MSTRKVQPEIPRNIDLTATEAKYERLLLQGLSPEQIAETTGRTVATVQNALFRARLKRRDLENLKVAGRRYPADI